MKVAIIVGHSILKNGTCTSAKGEVLEYSYCKELAPIVQKYLKSKGHQVDVIICPEREFTKAYQEKTYKLKVQKCYITLIKGRNMHKELMIN